MVSPSSHLITNYIMPSTSALSSVNAKTKRIAIKAKDKMKNVKNKLKEKSCKVDWKKVRNTSIQVGWEVTKLTVQIVVSVLGN